MRRAKPAAACRAIAELDRAVVNGDVDLLLGVAEFDDDPNVSAYAAAMIRHAREFRELNDERSEIIRRRGLFELPAPQEVQ